MLFLLYLGDFPCNRSRNFIRSIQLLPIPLLVEAFTTDVIRFKKSCCRPDG